MKKQLIASLLVSAILRAQSSAQVDSNTAYIVAQQAYALAQANDVHQLATGTNNCYSAYAVSQAYQQTNYYNAQIERSLAAHAREMDRINRYLRGW